ncbi:MAG: EthD family reductase [Vicinamibacteraceae bacterium]
MLNRRDFVSGAAMSVGVMTALSSEMVQAAPEPTMSLNVIYPNREGARFDASYYRSSHIPLAMKVMKAASVTLIEGLPMGTTAPPFAMICHFEFASAEALKAAVADPGMAEVRADIAKFTDITPTIMLGKS